MSKIFLSVIIPSYNEMANLQKGVLDKVEHYLSKQKYAYEVLIVDDGSTDGSVEFVEDFVKENSKFKLIKNPHLGKAGAVTAGILKAVGEYRLFTDMDQATPIDELDKLSLYLNKEFDIVIGSRNSHRKGAPFTRAVMARGMIVLRSLIVGVKDIKDTQCGFKIFNEKSAEELFFKLQKFHHGFKQISGSAVKAGFDVELLFLAEKLGYKIKEVPVSWLYVESRRVSPVMDSVNAFADLIRIRLNDVAGKYKNL
ncbi:MAG: glycosyltransferase [Patescibacteria group bacterium]|nr:glycosyltransferase [Patescibacteria group bacterium]